MFDLLTHSISSNFECGDKYLHIFSKSQGLKNGGNPVFEHFLRGSPF